MRDFPSTLLPLPRAEQGSYRRWRRRQKEEVAPAAGPDGPQVAPWGKTGPPPHPIPLHPDLLSKEFSSINWTSSWSLEDVRSSSEELHQSQGDVRGNVCSYTSLEHSLLHLSKG